MMRKANDFFYPGGQFSEAKAKEAYFEMMDYYHYPIPESFKGDKFWCPDFEMDDFSNVGMGGVIWENHNYDGGGYMGHEIFLLPGQMLPEHAHVAVEGVCPPKQEAWLVRHGQIYNFSVKAEASDFPDGVEIPESQKPYCKVNACDKVIAGETDRLKNEGEMHFMMAGPAGAIVTEFATFHHNDALRFTHPKLQFAIKKEALS
ncbi:MAG: hypothetical protein HQL32_08370 [Planctomycetes bacterium]|nr:hypothetical protein [Planctomycetota bacterium]